MRPVREGALSGDTFTTVNGYVLEGKTYYDPLISASIGGQDRFYLFDGLGPTRQLLDSNQDVTDSYAYEAFGNLISDGGPTPNPYRYVGSLGYYQTGNDLMHLGARYYMPEVGRFVQADPATPQWHSCAYGADNPLTVLDPEGLTVISNLGFLWNWLTGGYNTDAISYLQTLEVAELMNSPGGSALRDRFYAEGCKGFTNGSYSTVQAAQDTLLNPAYWSSTALQVGGFTGATATNVGNGNVVFTIKNVGGTNSFFYHVVPDRAGTTGPMHTITQNFIWVEPIDPSKCKCNERK